MPTVTSSETAETARGEYYLKILNKKYSLIVKDSGMREKEVEKREAKRTKVLQCL